jgi:hypothetical protein
LEQRKSDAEHVPKNLLDFFDRNMLQFFEFKRFFFDQMSLSDRDAFKGGDPGRERLVIRLWAG